MWWWWDEGQGETHTHAVIFFHLWECTPWGFVESRAARILCPKRPTQPLAKASTSRWLWARPSSLPLKKKWTSTPPDKPLGSPSGRGFLFLTFSFCPFCVHSTLRSFSTFQARLWDDTECADWQQGSVTVTKQKKNTHERTTKTQRVVSPYSSIFMARPSQRIQWKRDGRAADGNLGSSLSLFVFILLLF